MGHTLSYHENFEWNLWCEFELELISLSLMCVCFSIIIATSQFYNTLICVNMSGGHFLAILIRIDLPLLIDHIQSHKLTSCEIEYENDIFIKEQTTFFYTILITINQQVIKSSIKMAYS